MPTALMQKLLDNGEQPEESPVVAKAPTPKVEVWSLGSVELEEEESSNGFDDSEASQSEDEDDDMNMDDPKIPKKTEIFEGKVIQVEKLVKQEEELLGQ